MRIYQNYHKHTQNSNPIVSDSIVSNEDYAKRAKELGHGIISIMEHGWSGRAIDGWELAEQYDLKFIQGAELYWVKDRFVKDGNNCHIYIGAMNERGRRSLNDISSEAFITGFYRRGRVDIELLLSLPPEDVIVTTACLAFHKYDDTDELILRLADHFKDHFYLEVQYHNTKKQSELNEHLLQMHYKEKIPIIMGCDSHYVDIIGEKDRTEFLISKKMYYEDEEDWFLDYPDGDTAYDRFANQCILSHHEIEQAIDNTNVFLNVEQYECPCFNKEIKMPTIYPKLSQKERDDKYEDLIWNNWEKEKNKVDQQRWNEYRDEITKELETVRVTKHSDYFLFNNAMIKKGKLLGGILTQTSRGSSPSFYTNKLAGFTDIDRIAAKVHMYPERFMSPTRILQTKSLADIDFNVADPEPFAKAQIDVLGKNHSYPMIAYGTMKASSAWKMYARAKEIDFELANVVSGQIKKYEKALKHSDEYDKDDIIAYDYIDEQFHDIYSKSIEYQGVVTDYSPHPCAYLVYNGDIRREIGLVRIKNKICCCMDGKWAEEYKFLKNDILKVNVVELIDRAFRYAGVPMLTSQELLNSCPPEDKVWDIYKTGCTLGINQVEKEGTSHRIMKYSPTNISELCSFVAAIRPGFKSMYKHFESRKHFEYGIKSLDKIIQTEEMPHSFILYQEMSMSVLNYAGIPMTECYEIIKNIAKKRVEKVLGYKQQFIKGFKNVLMVNEQKSEDEAKEMSDKVWQILEDSSQYSFNASHSYCVSIDSLYGAYLKTHYPLSFYKAYLEIQEDKGNKEKMNKAKAEAESYFSIKFPPYRFGQDNRNITINKTTNCINNCLTAIKGFGKSISLALYYASLFNVNTLTDILYILDYYGLKSSKTIPLTKIDYFRDFGNETQVLLIISLFDDFKQGERKTLNKKEAKGWMNDVIPYYARDKTKSGKESKVWTFCDMPGFLRACERTILSLDFEDIDYRTKINNQIEILDCINFQTNAAEDRKKLIIMECYPLQSSKKEDPWGHVVITQSIGSGKKSRLTIRSNLFNKIPVKKLDIIQIKDFYKNNKGYWYLEDYELIS